jgi:hypothetical protein
MSTSKHSSQKGGAPKLRERAVRIVHEAIAGGANTSVW